MAPSIFTLPMPLYQQPTSSRSAQSRPKKRKRTGVQSMNNLNITNPAELADSSIPSGPNQQSSTISEYSAVLSPLERHQYRIAGQPFDKDLPRNPFPHAAVSREELLLQNGVNGRNRLSEQDLPINTTNQRCAPTSLHQQHLGVMTTILHRCLLEKDFIRAGRAWSIILRDETADLQSEGRWGIGAEICLRQGVQMISEQEEQNFDTTMSSKYPREGQNGILRPWFTRKGFEEAKKYYERLIIQYPFHKSNAGAISALDFYLAMFGMWVYVVQAETKLYEFAEEPEEPDISSRESSISHWRLSQRTAAVQRELEQAREIASRMDSCMDSLPYRDDIELMRLRAIVALWIADLCDDHFQTKGS